MPDYPVGTYSPLVRPRPKTTLDLTKKGIPHQPPPEKLYPLPVVPVERMLTTAQVAIIMAVSIDTLKKWRQRSANGPRFIRYGDGSIRYRLSTVLRYIDDHETKR
jgi:hypothetical protein